MPESSPLPTTARLLDLTRAMAGQPILMLVDLVADRFITGSPKRISREAPVLILRYEGETLTPGGGANAVANVAALGGKPLTIGVVGKDENGRRLLDALRAAGVDTEGILERTDFRTPTKTRVLGGGRHSIKQQIVRFDIEDSRPLSSAEADQVSRRLRALEGQASVAVLSDYGYGAVLPSLVGPVREAVGAEGTILCDSRYRLAEFTGLDGATPNEEEADGLLGETSVGSEESMSKAGQRLRQVLGAGFLLVTRGSFGMTLIEADGWYQIPVHGTDQVADVTGAGDTVIGTFALAIAGGGSPLEAALLADYAGGVVVMKSGTATLTREELEAAIATDSRPLEELQWQRF